MGKNKIVKLIGSFLIFIGISIGFFFIFKAFGLTNPEEIKEVIIEAGVWGVLIFVILMVLFTTILNLIPGIGMMFIVIASSIYGPFYGFLISVFSIYITSSIMFYIGDRFGERVVIKIVGEEEVRKVQDLIDVKSKLFLPIMLMFPFFPDDTLCMVAGMTKMKYKYFMSIVLIFRTIGIVFASYSVTILKFFGYESWTTLEWAIVINLLIVDAYFIYKFVKWLENKIKK